MDVLGEWLRRTRVEPARIARSRLQGPFGLSFEVTDVVLMHVLLEGTMWLRAKREDRLLSQGDVVLLPNGTPHAVLDDPASPVIDFACVAPDADPSPVQPELALGVGEPRRTLLCAWFPFDDAAPNAVLAALPDVLHLPAPRSGGGLRSTIGLLTEEMDSVRPGAGPIVDALVDIALVQTIRAASEHTADVCSGCMFEGLDDPVTRTALQLMHRHPERAWTVQGLATEVGLSRAAFARRFRDRVGQPPSSYLTRWRMTRTVELLRTTDDPLDVIARAVGYESGFALSRAVKRELGRTPTQLRRTAL